MARIGIDRSRFGVPAIPFVLLAFLVAGCNQVGTNNVTFWDIIWSMVFFFFWFTFIWIFISLFGDIIRRDDLSGAAKAGWLLLLVVLPFLGALIYIAMRPKVTAGDVRRITQMEAGAAAVAAVSPADQIAKLQELRAAGAITDAEYEKLKAQAMG